MFLLLIKLYLNVEIVIEYVMKIKKCYLILRGKFVKKNKLYYNVISKDIMSVIWSVAMTEAAQPAAITESIPMLTPSLFMCFFLPS